MSYHLLCPKCKHEFKYDNEYIDENITKLGQEIHDINIQLAEYNLLSLDEKRRKRDWLLRAKKSISMKQKDLGELKAIRKKCDQQLKFYEHEILKRLIKERVGEIEYMKIIETMKEELEAYKISGLMWREYSRSNAKSNVTNINKL